MKYQTPSNYFNQLHESIQNTIVTDHTSSVITLDQGVQRVVTIILKVLQENKKIMIIGNGGSAAIASHVHNDLSKSVGLRALTFTESSLLTALSNDLHYREAFEEQIKLWANKNDLLIAISSSGKSENIIRAVESAKIKGSSVITLSGFNVNNPLRSLGDINFYVSSDSYGFVETAHAALLHCITDFATLEKNSLLKP